MRLCQFTTNEPQIGKRTFLEARLYDRFKLFFEFSRVFTTNWNTRRTLYGTEECGQLPKKNSLNRPIERPINSYDSILSMTAYKKIDTDLLIRIYNMFNTIIL